MDIRYGYVTQEKVEDVLVSASREMSTETVMSWQLQARGGACPLCHRPFVPVEVENAFGKFTHYIPGCLCFQICMTAGGKGCCDEYGRWDRDRFYWRPGCRRLLIEERLKNSSYCFNCGGLIPMSHKDPGINWDTAGGMKRRTF